jgi:hypothetical protein
MIIRNENMRNNYIYAIATIDFEKAIQLANANSHKIKAYVD